MANLAYPQSMNQHFGVVHPNAMNTFGPQMTQVMPPQFYSPIAPQMHANTYPNQPMSPSGAQIAYVPVLVDAQGRPIQNMQNLMAQSFLPTVGLNQAMQAPWLKAPGSPTNPLGIFPMEVPTQQGSSSRSPSATSSDSGSTAGSVSPELAPLHRKLPPGLSLDDTDDNTWFRVNEGLLELDNVQKPKPVKKIVQVRPTPQPKIHKKKKFGYRSKQNKIDTVYAALVAKYTANETLVDQEAVLRGPDVIRLHVKKYDALCTIEDALETVESYIKIVGVSIPLSMKNTFQKKGFLVYIKLDDVEKVGQAQTILRTFPEFKKCAVANVASSTTTTNTTAV